MVWFLPAPGLHAACQKHLFKSSVVPLNAANVQRGVGFCARKMSQVSVEKGAAASSRRAAAAAAGLSQTRETFTRSLVNGNKSVPVCPFVDRVS